jgi:methyl-accepting chemotaxis protein
MPLRIKTNLYCIFYRYLDHYTNFALEMNDMLFKRKRNLGIGFKILGITISGFLILIVIFLSTYFYSMNKVDHDAQKIIGDKLQMEIKNEMQYNVQSVVSVMEAIYKANQGKMDEAKLVAMILENLHESKYGKDGYFFGYRYDGVKVLAPDARDTVGQNMWDAIDPNGVKTTQEFIAAAKKNGDFVFYTWLDASTKRNEPKISYVAPLRLGNLVIALGTGTYIPVIEASKREVKATIGTTKNQIATIVVVILLITCALILTGMYLFITKFIVRPVKKLVDVSNELSNGNLDVDFDIATNDEMGLLGRSFKTMTVNLNDVMTNINTAAEQVAAGSKQVADSSTALSQGTTEQAGVIEQLSASLEQISSQTKQNAKDANQANELAVLAKTNAIKGNQQMQEMLTAMAEINKASGNISKIIKVIDEIAFQTNILALNAAVEAARAGAQGKGFAVVAEEVRNLAARSANAAKETTTMIEGSIVKAKDGTGIANQTAEALNEIVEGITKAANLVGNIAHASNEQATGITEINQGIMQVSTVVQNNSATSEESAAASEELASQAELLKEQVSRYKLKTANSVYRTIPNLTPDVLKMLEHLSAKSQTDSPETYSLTDSAKKQRIALTENEFGKY